MAGRNVGWRRCRAGREVRRLATKASRWRWASERVGGAEKGNLIGLWSDGFGPSEDGLTKVAGFDLDGTLVETASGRKAFMRVDGHDWRYAFPGVRARLLDLLDDGFKVAVLSNQNTIKGAHQGKAASKLRLVVDSLVADLGAPDGLCFLGATQKDHLRKGEGIGMWTFLASELLRDKVDLAESFFVGDAVGGPGQHGAADRDFAAAVGLPLHVARDYFTSDRAQQRRTTARRT